MRTVTEENFKRLSIGLEHRWENSLDGRVEFFYNGSGKSRVWEYMLASSATNVYLARRYAAAGLSYEFAPLLNGQMLLLTNLVDHSWLLSVNGVYSLSDEAEMSLSLSLPYGRKPKGGLIYSEYGSADYALVLEWRSYY